MATTRRPRVQHLTRLNRSLLGSRPLFFTFKRCWTHAPYVADGCEGAYSSICEELSSSGPRICATYELRITHPHPDDASFAESRMGAFGFSVERHPGDDGTRKIGVATDAPWPPALDY